MSKRNKTKKRRIAEPQSQSSKIPVKSQKQQYGIIPKNKLCSPLNPVILGSISFELTREQLACLENTLVKMSK